MIGVVYLNFINLNAFNNANNIITASITTYTFKL
jgi:hypothetical protein